jgi:hypothetical protein
MERFTKLDAAGADLPSTAENHVAVRDNTTGLTWSAGNVGDDKELTWKKANEACGTLDLCGASDWRLPTVEELFALSDHTRYRPAIDSGFFPSTKSDWYWTSTPAASAPGECAWVVSFGNGDALILNRNPRAFVRAVRSARASQ